jgi:hypothetical protein
MAKSGVERKQTSLWVLASDLKRADKLTKRIAANPEASSIGDVTRSAVLRLALTRGLTELEKQYK